MTQKTSQSFRITQTQLIKKAGGLKNIVKVGLLYSNDYDLGNEFSRNCDREELVKVLEKSSVDFGIGKTLVDIRVNYSLAKSKNPGFAWIDKHDLCMLLPKIRPHYSFYLAK